MPNLADRGTRVAEAHGRQSNNHQQPSQQAARASNPQKGGGLASASPRDAAGTRRQPPDPDHFLNGRDISTADLSWALREPGSDVSINPRTGQPLLYPKRTGASNLVDFKDEIEERTRNGQGCKAIAEALVEKGVNTTSRAVAGQRIKWGITQRAPRRMTEQGIANIRKAHERTKQNTSSDRAPAKAVRVLMRRAEIIRMTNGGMSAAQIAENLQSRGVDLKPGPATVEALRTKWGLLSESQRRIENVRQSHRNVAMRLQREQFENIATELGIEDVKAWVNSKMNDEAALEARLEHAYRLMGNLRPGPVDPRTMKGIVKFWKAEQARKEARNRGAEIEGVEASGQQATSAQSGTPSESGAADHYITISDDATDLEGEDDDEDC